MTQQAQREGWIEQQEDSSDSRVVALTAGELRQLLRDAMAFADAHREPPVTFVRPEFPVEDDSLEQPSPMRVVDSSASDGTADAHREGQEDGEKVELHDIYQAIHDLHKSGTLEHCWYQACECEKIWKAVKEFTSRQQDAPTPPPREQGDE